MTLVDNPYIQHQLEKLDAEEINYRYELEDKVMLAISKGDYEEYQELQKLEGAPNDFNPLVKRFRHDPLRDRKNGLMTRKTFMRIAARVGGVPPVYLHLLAERYSVLIETATSTDYLDNYLAEDMAKAFCDAVKTVSVKNYSATIKQAIQYIDSHLTENITVQSLAEDMHLHPNYLSRKFKQETNWNLSDYVNNQRVNFAILQFYRGNEDITEVALSCGYNSSSYFSKVFKKHTGSSPSDFIKHSLASKT